MRLAVIVPSGDTIMADSAMCLARLVAHQRGDVTLVNPKSSLVQKGRTDGLAAAVRAGATHLLFVDSDMVFPPDTAARLAAHEQEIVGVIAPRRRPPIDLIGQTVDGSKALGRGLVEAHWLGMGVMLVAKTALERMKAPFFAVIETPSGWVSEDQWFCKQAREAGVSIWADTDLSQAIGHIGSWTHKPPMTVG